MWFLTLIVLALATFFVVKAMKSQGLRKAAEKERQMQSSGLEGSLNTNDPEAGSAKTEPSLSSHRTASSSTSSLNETQAAFHNATDTSSASSSESSSNSSHSAEASSRLAISAGSILNASDAEALNSGDLFKDIREMIKILNLAEPDAVRLTISREEFTALRHGEDSTSLSGDSLSVVADRLRKMLA